MNKLFHKISHWFGSNEGDIVSCRVGDDIYIAFKCRTCGKIEGAHCATLNHYKEPNYDEPDNSNS